MLWARISSRLDMDIVFNFVIWSAFISPPMYFSPMPSTIAAMMPSKSLNWFISFISASVIPKMCYCAQVFDISSLSAYLAYRSIFWVISWLEMNLEYTYGGVNST